MRHPTYGIGGTIPQVKNYLERGVFNVWSSNSNPARGEGYCPEEIEGMRPEPIEGLKLGLHFYLPSHLLLSCGGFGASSCREARANRSTQEWLTLCPPVLARRTGSNA